MILGLSGSDAIEAAMKSAVLATRKSGIVAFEGGYHGLSHGPLAACGYQSSFREPFRGQLNPHVTFAPYPAKGRDETVAQSVASVTNALRSGETWVPCSSSRSKVAAESSKQTSKQSKTIADLAHQAGASARGGRDVHRDCHRAGGGLCFTRDAWPVAPDVLCLGKALGATLPLSACLLRAEVAQAWGDPAGEAIHTSTFLGNPLACGAALAGLDLLESGADSRKTSCATTADRLAELALMPILRGRHARVRGITGRGLLIGVQLTGGVPRALRVVRSLLERGYIVLASGSGDDHGLCLTPPGCLSSDQIADFGKSLGDVLRAVAP